MKKQLINSLIKDINNMVKTDIRIMEVCGTHTQMISKLGLRTVLSPQVKLLSGPGCPVCVTDEKYIDTAIKMLDSYDITIATFGDLMRVKGSKGSLLDEKSKGKDIRVLYSPLDLITIAKKNKDQQFVFLGVGFETTAPIIALTIKKAAQEGIDNLSFLTSIKLMDPILHYILQQPKRQIQGLICPGHVACIKGAESFKFIVDEYKMPAAVCGFEALDILSGIHYIVKQITHNEDKVFQNLYQRCVRPQGNVIANELIEEIFEQSMGDWRGIGKVPSSSLSIKEEYRKLDACSKFHVDVQSLKQEKCECSDILLGNKMPSECRLFDEICNPINPYGPCMVSSEGACAIAYKYREV